MTPYYSDASVTLYHADNRKMLPLMEAKSVDCVLTDPPYLLDYDRCITWGRKDGGPAARDVEYAPFAPADLEVIAPMLARLPKRWLLVWSDIESTGLWRESLVSAGMRYVRTGLWTRTNPTPQFTGDRPGTPAEAVTICHAEGMRMRWNGGGRAARWDVAQRHGTTGSVANEHPTPKPLELARALIRDFTDPGEVILDCFAGSGAFGAAARLEGRLAILIEREEKYCELIARRLERNPREHNGQLVLLGGER